MPKAAKLELQPTHQAMTPQRLPQVLRLLDQMKRIKLVMALQTLSQERDHRRLHLLVLRKMTQVNLKHHHL